MDLLLDLRLAGHDTRADVVVEIDPDDTVASLVDALAGYAQRRGLDAGVGGSVLYREGTAQPLAPASRVVDTGLVSGETVALGPGVAGLPADGALASMPPPPPSQLRAHEGDGWLSLDVTSGPEAGRIMALAPGHVTVGRAPSCTIAVDDPTLSREHFMLQVAPDGQVFLVPNPAATNGTVVGADAVREARAVRPGELIQAGSSAFVLRLSAPDATRRRDRLGQVPFNRVPYRRSVVTPRHFDELAAPPRAASTRRLSIATAMMPAVSAVALATVTQRWYLLGLAVVSPLLMVWRWISDKRSGGRGYHKDREAFYERVEGRAADIDGALADERQERLAASPDLADLARQAMFHMPRLWERNRTVADFLELRLGIGDLASQVSAPIERGGDDELRNEGTGRLAHRATVRDVAVTVNLVDVGVLGLWGDPEHVRPVAGALVAQAACLHSPEDLVIAGAVGAGELDRFEWLKWLPHVRSATSPLEGEHLAVGADATRRLLVNLLGVARDRTQRSGSGGVHPWPRVLVALGEAAEPDRALLSQLLDVAPHLGIHLLWMGESDLQVPRQCRAVVACPGARQPARLGFTDPSLPHHVVELDGIRPSTAAQIARALAPLRDASASSQTTAIPRVVPLFDALGIGEPTPGAIAERWRNSRPYGLEFPIGMAADGPLVLDLVEQGPHTLIGGTSGAGKSELLQTLVLSLAAHYPPERLNFLFVDYKGGASSAEFRDLPHTVGYVTNLSGRLSMRALASLRAELQRRMTLLEGKAKDLAEMLQVAPAEAPPSLVIVVDEFAALVKEIPDFVAGVVDIAQRGRSLGIHLVLATQRPTGVVNDNILANTNLRISLRMLDPADSNNVIGSRDAADIPVPLRGRAYARTGPQALVAFQCAWSGAPCAVDQQVRAIAVRPFRFGRSDTPAAPAATVADAAVTAPNVDGGGVEPATQLEVLVNACAGAARALGLPAARRPWVEPLGEVVPIATVLNRVPVGEISRDPGRTALLGLYDDPENQAQHVASIDLEASGGLLVFGTGGSGKTTLLRTVAGGMAAQGTADEVTIYALDFASRALDALADLPQCGAVVPGDDPERVTRLMTVVAAEIDRRRGVLADARAESLGALRERSGTTVFPRIVLLLDSYSGFHSAFDRAEGYGWLTQLQQIVSAGRQVGVHCVITTERRMGVPAALLSAVSARLALRMATGEELASLGVPMKVAKDAELPAGRGFLDGSVEVQVACVSEDASGAAQAEALSVAAGKLATADDARAPRLPELPESVDFDDPRSGALAGPLAAPTTKPLTAPLAVVDLTLEVAEVDLSRQNLVVTGPPLSGKSTALETVARGVRAASGPDLQLAALGSAASPLAALDVWDDAALSRAGHAGLVERLAERLSGDEGVDARAVLFVDAAEDLEGNDVLRPLEVLARRDALRLVVACEPTTIAKAYSGWLSALRRNRVALVLQPESRADVDAAVGVKPALRPGQDFPPGRGILVVNRQWSLVQVGRRGGAP